MVKHYVGVRAPRFDEGPISALLQRGDEGFLPAIFDELKTAPARERLRGSEAKEREDGFLRLYRPVHRVHHIALFEVYCEEPGQPRLDPARIESAGMVIRRVSASASGAKKKSKKSKKGQESTLATGKVEAWLSAPEAARGWFALDAHAEDLDPDPERRPPPLRSGNPLIDRKLAQLVDSGLPMAESVTTLFPVPRDVCEASGRTLLVGVLPTGSDEESELPRSTADGGGGYEVIDIWNQMPALLEGSWDAGPKALPRPGQQLDAEDGGAADLKDFVAMVGRMVVRFGMLEEGPGPEALRAKLNEYTVRDAGGATRKLGDVIANAARVLLYRSESETFRMPRVWADLSPADQLAIAVAIRDSANQRLETFRPRETRFGDQDALYVARAFVRIRHDDTCPPELVWGAPSEPFRIAPWWANGPHRPKLIELPGVELDNLKKLKPNVAFKVPRRVFNLLDRNSADDFIKGNASEGDGGLDLDWICGFNIPILTLCAFIVLSIFLVLFHLLFWWLPFVKICIPVPK